MADNEYDDEENKKKFFSAHQNDWLYLSLGLSSDASDDEIKKRYYDLAGKYHPDKNEDNPEATTKFQEISYAYSILGDTEKRKQYDAKQITADEKRGYSLALQNYIEMEKAKGASSKEKTLDAVEVNQEVNGKNSSKTKVNATTKTHATEIAKDESYRLRSQNSDQNEFLMDRLKLKVFLDMGVINQHIYDAGIQRPDAAIEKIQNVRQLNDKELADFQDRISAYMLQDEKLFEIIPPEILAKEYARHLSILSSMPKDSQAYGLEQQLIARLEKRIDQLITDAYSKQNLFFADVTNVADTYDGYMHMFEAREKTLGNTEADKNKLAMIQSNRNVLNELISQYDGGWNLTNVTQNDEPKLNKRFDDLTKILPQTSLDDETIRLVSNFQFLDQQGNIEPQFIDKDGNKRTTYEAGCKIIENSKLENIIRVARQNVLMNELGSADEISKSALDEKLRDEVPFVLYSTYVVSQTEKGILENPKQFTDKKYFETFISSLSDIRKPVSVSDSAYEASIDNNINSVGAFAHRLGDKVGKDKDIVTKVFEPLKDLDKRAKDRVVTNGVDKRKIRIEMLKRTAKGAASAFLVSGAITIASTAATTAADASITASSLGLNKVAGLAVGSAAAITMTALQIRRWRKERKKNGQKANLKAFLKDRRMVMTVATTALGAAALGFAVTGNPGVAQILGYSSMAMGAANGIISNAQDAVKSGLGKWEAAGWATLQTVATVGAGFAGRWTANQGINYFNEQNPDNNIFQHKEKTGEHWEKVGTDTVVDYAKIEENAKEFLQNNWYKDNPDLLQQRLDALQAAGVENPGHALLISHDAGMIAPDNMELWGGTHSHGNHTVLTQSWAEQNNVDFKDVQAMKNLFNSDGSVNIEAAKSYNNLAPHVGEDNFVSRIEDRPVIRELYGDRESTYDHTPKIPLKEVDILEKVDDYTMVRNETNLGLGMFGVMGKIINPVKKLKDRVGSLLDRMVKPKKGPIDPVGPVDPIIPPTPPKPEKEDKFLEEHKEPKQIGPHKELKQLPEHEEPKQIGPHKELKQLPAHVDSIDQLLDREYKVVHGIAPDKPERLRYRTLVDGEWKKEGSDMNFERYLEERWNVFEQSITLDVAPNDEAKGFADTKKGIDHINTTRETIWKTNLSVDNVKLESKDVTLLSFMMIASVGKNNAENAKLKAAEDRGRAPAKPGKSKKPSGKVYNIDGSSLNLKSLGKSSIPHNNPSPQKTATKQKTR